MGRVSRAAALITIAILCGVVPVPAAADHLLVPGGAAALRRVTGIPDHVPDSMLLSEAARAWYGVRAPAPTDARKAAELVTYLTTSKEPSVPGPWLPLSAATWMRLLDVKSPAEIAPALARDRRAMLLYRGLTGMDDGTLEWLDTQPDLLAKILMRTAPVFATVAPAIIVSSGAVIAPGGAPTAQAWSSLIGEAPARPADFIRVLVDRDNGRIAWMYSVLSGLPPERVRFAVGDNGASLTSLGSLFTKISPEWDMRDRAFTRPLFDPAIPLMLVDLARGGSPAGPAAFWKEVFRTDDPKDWREAGSGTPLTGAMLLDIIFGSRADIIQPVHARTRWEVFSLGQRMLRTAPAGREVGLALRASMRFPVVAASLERMGVLTPASLHELSDAASRMAGADSDGSRGELAVWQAVLVTIERAAITGGLDAEETAALVSSFAGLPLTALRRELTAWFFDVWIARVLSRPGAPADAEAALLRTMAGDLTRTGPRRTVEFNWEDLRYRLATEERAFTRMGQARASQGKPSIEDARIAWRGASADLAVLCKRLQDANTDPVISSASKRIASAILKNDTQRVDRERRELADAILGSVLPLVAYAPQQAASDAPALGGELALRHEVAAKEGPVARRQRPWRVATPVAFEGQPWHLAGSLLSLDVPLSVWYLRTNGEAPMGTPTIEDPDVDSLALSAVLGTPEDVAAAAKTLDAVEAGRTRTANSPDGPSVDALLAAHGIDPWRRRALRLGATSHDEIATRLTPSEAWRVGADAPPAIAPRMTLDGCPCLGEMPLAPMIAEGRPSNGMIGAIVPGMSLRILLFLKARALPLALYRPLVGGVAFDIIHSASAVRTDDMLALDVAAAQISDTRLEEHVLALIADGTLAPPLSPDLVRP